MERLATVTTNASTEPTAARKPRDDEIDLFGVTHPGKVRDRNEDHFLVGSLFKRLAIWATSLPDCDALRAANERLASLAMVADGVGGEAAGEEASRLALEEITQYITHSTDCYYVSDARAAEFIDHLQAAATRAHQRVLERARADAGLRGMATTLTLWIITWPWAYLLQVGDSRYYLYRGGTLQQVTRDQTIAQELIDKGVMTRAAAAGSPLTHVLSSALGGEQTVPVVTRILAEWTDVHLLCSDGLTKHVSDERIAERLRTMTSARQACEALLQDALDGGGTDNISIVVARSVPKDPP